MAQIDFFIDDVLEKKLIEYLFSLDFEFIPSIDSEIEKCYQNLIIYFLVS